MAEPIFYVDRSDINEGAIDDVRTLQRGLAAFVEANEPQLIAYNFYIDETERTMTVIAVHPDPASMELHLDIGGPKFREFGPYITLRSIDVYGEPSAIVLGHLREKAQMLGSAIVTLHRLEAGFTRRG